MDRNDSREDVRSVAKDVPSPRVSTAGPIAQPMWRVQANNRSAQVRLQPYIDKAIKQQKYQYRLSKVVKYGINFILMLQIAVGALVTIVSVLAPSERTRIVTAVLGALGSLTAAVLARAKGTNQPERAETHSRDMEKFISRCQLFVGDVGTAIGPDIDAQVLEFVNEFDAIEDKAVQSSRGRETATGPTKPGASAV
ncbi:hypothetical protein BDV93DRAFT_601470 [Ceratobasidium sp. AG-I]|nr:hypothetical protein BDV93DRAFT_601470 [Ceratobasidium sp. AG-I]